MHSTASDGVLCPSDILLSAKRQGLAHIAISDHDCFAGNLEAQQLKARYCVDVIPAVEITTQTDGREVHLLGYFMDLHDRALTEVFVECRKSRESRALAIAERIGDAGLGFGPEEVLATGQTINRCLLARMLVDRGIAQSSNDAFSRFIGRSGKFYVENEHMETAQAIALLREAQGYPFIAHPAYYAVVDLISRLKEYGLSGLEAYHSMQSMEQSRKLCTLARELGLGVSGGSDWHGDATHGSRLGGAGLTRSAFDDFLVTCERL